MKRALYLIVGITSALVGIIGVFVPVLPTTPLLLLSAFCLSRSSQRLDDYLRSTSVFRHYVEPFQSSGGITARRKAYILCVSIGVMAISGFVVGRWYVWLILGAVTVWLLYLMLIRIKTVTEAEDAEARIRVQEELDVAHNRLTAETPEA